MMNLNDDSCINCAHFIIRELQSSYNEKVMAVTENDKYNQPTYIVVGFEDCGEWILHQEFDIMGCGVVRGPGSCK